MFDASLRAETIELLARSFNSDEIAEIGRLVLRKFDLYRLTNRHAHVTVPVRDAAQTLVEACEEKNKVADLIQLVVETDGALLMGRRIAIKDLELFLASLARADYVYDHARRKLRRRSHDRSELPNWGALREGREYEMTVASVDIVGSSRMVRNVGRRTAERLYYQFWEFLRARLSHYDGRIWSWAGDGGILAFTMTDDAVRAVECALETQATIPIFNARPENPLREAISVRIGLDRGRIRFMADTGRIVSEVINFASHAEKAVTDPGRVTISDTLHAQLPHSLRRLFESAGIFEGREIHTTISRVDGWSAAETARETAPASPGETEPGEE
ncbi:MAG: adenylate/guanylate cyclase domain-containing protein [Spirochaetaceae bacterium]